MIESCRQFGMHELSNCGYNQRSSEQIEVRQHETVYKHAQLMGKSNVKPFDHRQQIREILEPTIVRLLATACERVFDKILSIYVGNLYYLQVSRDHDVFQPKSIKNQSHHQIYDRLLSQMKENSKGYIQFAELIQTPEVRDVFQKYLPDSYMRSQSSKYIKHKTTLLRRAVFDHSSRLWANNNSVRLLDQLKEIEAHNYHKLRQLIVFVDGLETETDEETVLSMLGLTNNAFKAQWFYVHIRQYEIQEPNCESDFINEKSDNEDGIYAQQQKHQYDLTQLDQTGQKSQIKTMEILEQYAQNKKQFQITKKCASVYLQARIAHSTQRIPQHHELVKFILSSRPNIEYTHNIRVLSKTEMDQNNAVMSEITETLLRLEIDEIGELGKAKQGNRQQAQGDTNEKCHILQQNNSLFFDCA